MVAWLHRGFTLVELLVAMTIAILLLVLAMPGYVVWISDNEIRNGAESVASGLRYAQAAAIFSATSTPVRSEPHGWNVMMVDTPLVPIQTASFNEGSRNAIFAGRDASAVAATLVAFNALGQTVASPVNLVQIDISMPSVAGTHPLRVLVGNGRTGIKMCDPDPMWVFSRPERARHDGCRPCATRALPHEFHEGARKLPARGAHCHIDSGDRRAGHCRSVRAFRAKRR